MREIPRVAITGVGLVSPLGRDRGALLGALVEGRRAIAPSRFPRWLAAEVADFDPAREAGRSKNLKYMSRSSALAVAAARGALAESRLSIESDAVGDDVGLHVAIGMTSSEVSDLEKLVAICEDEQGRVSLARLGEHGLRATNPLLSFRILTNMPLCHVALATRARGPNAAIQSTGGETFLVLKRAIDELREERARAVIFGAVDAQVDRAGLEQLARRGLMASEARDAALPFSERSTGRVLGEGAAFFVLELEASARARGARVLATVEMPAVESARTTGLDRADAGPITAVLERALAGRAPGVVFASASGDRRGDSSEAKALESAIGESAPVTATRGALGDSLAAGPALDLALAVASLERGIAPPLGLEQGARACAIDLVRGEPRSLARKQVAVAAAGISGIAGACVVAHPEVEG